MHAGPQSLRGRWILIVEDDCITAMDLAETLSSAGARVVGPAATIETAFELVRCAPHLDLALLDVDVDGTFTFEVADELARHGIPIVFATGYERSEIPTRFDGVRHCEKPVRTSTVIQALSEELIH